MASEHIERGQTRILASDVGGCSRLAGVVLLTLAATSPAHARDGFERVRCDGDIAKALIGQRGANEPAMAIEARHKNLGLRDLGASDFGAFSQITWLICGEEFAVLEDNRANIVRDALQIPPRSKGHPEFQGLCKRNGQPMADSVVAILSDQSGANELPAEVAWRIDEKAVKFVQAPTDGLLCPRDGISAPK